MKKIALLLCLTLLTMSCNNDDDTGRSEPNISGNWNLISVTGGVVGATSSFPQGLIQWNFRNGILTIQNTNTSGEIDLYPSGTYEYSIQGNQDGYFLFINDADHGLMEVDFVRLAVDGRKHIEGMCNDCFNFSLSR